MELSIRIMAGEVAESQRELLQAFLEQATDDLDNLFVKPTATMVLAKREVLKKDGDLELSRLVGTYTVCKGVRPVAEFYDKGLAYVVYKLLKGGDGD